MSSPHNFVDFDDENHNRFWQLIDLSALLLVFDIYPYFCCCSDHFATAAERPKLVNTLHQLDLQCDHFSDF